MTTAQQTALSAFLQSIAEVDWFAHCGEPDANAVVAGDLVEAWDGWGSVSLAIWSPETHALERIAVAELGDATVEAIFAAVAQATGDVLGAAMERYFQRRPLDTWTAQLNADRGLWPEWLDAVKRDLCWAAVEACLSRPGFFSDLLRYYRAGRWPCAWEKADRSGKVVLF